MVANKRKLWEDWRKKRRRKTSFNNIDVHLSTQRNTRIDTVAHVHRSTHPSNTIHLETCNKIFIMKTTLLCWSREFRERWHWAACRRQWEDTHGRMLSCRTPPWPRSQWWWWCRALMLFPPHDDTSLPGSSLLYHTFQHHVWWQNIFKFSLKNIWTHFILMNPPSPHLVPQLFFRIQ